MSPQAFDVTGATRLLIATATAAPQIRLQIVQATPSVAEAVFATVSVLRLLTEEAERRAREVLEEGRRERERLEQEIKATHAKVEELRQQVEKLELVMQKIRELLPKILDAVGSDPNCQPNRAVVADRVAKLKALQAAAQSAAEALDNPRYRAFLDWLRRLLEQVPVLFDIPGWR
jgi:cell division septum initiation protein DivIVA